MKPVASECAALTSKGKDTIDVIFVLKSWKKLSNIAGISLLYVGITLTLFNTTATKASAHLPATQINITQQYTATKAETKQSRSNRQYQTLRRKNQGLEVEYLQLRLREWGYFKQGITGIFGADTENAVKRFQQDADIFPSGIVDAQTWNAIDKKPNTSQSGTSQRCNRPTLQPGSEGQDVRDLQQRLYDLGYLKIRPSTYFGQATKQALIRYQQQQDLPATGTVNARTWEALKLSCKSNAVFVIAVPVINRFTLEDVKDYFPGAFVFNTESGYYVHAGQFSNQQEAKKRLDFLRGKGFNAQLIRRSST
ncbi:putative N-acetylmuramoyl-L-alanine amidase [Calothrix sp. NIES-4071]|nr:putative N-acetylmuramoyl-L-alanine amidase [Calothrix sp. NIES-4071]BAZ57073.1 putative N-acetylmuramoyl-L-alanine amidase [Calothrix sp. NIES-4105]